MDHFVHVQKQFKHIRISNDIRLSPIVENNELTHKNPTCNLLNILYTVAPMISCL